MRTQPRPAPQKAVDRARELGDDSGDLFRISAEIMSQRITGLASALTWNGKIQVAIAKAGERIKNDPQLHLVLGLRKLMAPQFLGNDPDKALEHFRYAAEALPNDERPAVFAAMASYLKKKRLKAIAWLEKAVQRNPRNVFARVVLKRVRRGEEDPFAILADGVGFVKYEGSIQRLAADAGSKEGPFGTREQYDGREYSLNITIDQSKKEGASETSWAAPATVTMEDGYDREVAMSEGRVACGG